LYFVVRWKAGCCGCSLRGGHVSTTICSNKEAAQQQKQQRTVLTTSHASVVRMLAGAAEVLRLLAKGCACQRHDLRQEAQQQPVLISMPPFTPGTAMTHACSDPTFAFGHVRFTVSTMHVMFSTNASWVAGLLIQNPMRYTQCRDLRSCSRQSLLPAINSTAAGLG
jgi:hypothetical protein